ncbi:hypothetical protein HHK36_014499 [Tetracentron sinense]|uniref:AT3G52170-like helix-turn-helix domain-containing protein n=1 Tax=Tetracentron sinense TaxID=13715 RepID=A0A835DFV2_TETSI|nr:hypothetical protein HHK36_014499 [Tetracentron sinense]
MARGLTFPSKHSATRFSDSKRVFPKISNAVRGSIIQWRASSFSASVPSNSSKPQRRQKRVLKDERHALVESFVDKYKALNAGKIPTPSAARKQVGGSYYTIKKILQELEYKSKISPISKRDENLSGKEELAKEEHESFTKIEESLSSKTTVGCISCEPTLRVKTVVVNDKLEEFTGEHFEAKEGPQISTSVGDTLFKDAVKPTTTVSVKTSLLFSITLLSSYNFHEAKNTQVGWERLRAASVVKGDRSNPYGTHSNQVKVGTEEVLDPCPEKLEDGKKGETTSEDLLDFNGPKDENMQDQEASESDKMEKDISRKETSDEELPKRSTVWGNLKSLADGIFNLWRKM